jgi:prophage tail gpP-like protein
MPSVFASRELQAVVASVKALPPVVRRIVRSDTRAVMQPEWRAAVARNARTDQERAVLAGGASMAGVVIKGTNPPVLVAASSRRRLRGGLVPAEDAAAFAAGTRRANERRTWRRRSPEGTTHTVQGWPNRQLQDFRRGGYVIYPAFRELAPRVVSYWTQSLMRAVADALRGG